MNPILPHFDDLDAFPMVVLASRSPRRRAMFEEIGIPHQVVPATIDDGDLDPGVVDPQEWVAALAYLKAVSSAKAVGAELSYDPNLDTVVLGADTVCVHNGVILGQPNNREDAHSMILSMSQAEHDVLTGIAIVDPITGRRELFVDRSIVTVGEISECEIVKYLDSGDWQGKAGAYNITDRLAAGWPIEFSGDETSIVGLPMTRTLERVARFFAN